MKKYQVKELYANQNVVSSTGRGASFNQKNVLLRADLKDFEILKMVANGVNPNYFEPTQEWVDSKGFKEDELLNHASSAAKMKSLVTKKAPVFKELNLGKNAQLASPVKVDSATIELALIKALGMDEGQKAFKASVDELKTMDIKSIGKALGIRTPNAIKIHNKINGK